MKVLGEVAAGVERKALKGATRGRMEFMVARTLDHHHTPHTTPTPPHNGIKPHHNTHTHPERRYFDHIQQPAAFSELEALLYSLQLPAPAAKLLTPVPHFTHPNSSTP